MTDRYEALRDEINRPGYLVDDTENDLTDIGGAMTDEYSGWTNRETWATALHLSNDHGVYLWCSEVAEEACRLAGEHAEQFDLTPNYARWAGEAIEREVMGAFNDTEPMFDPEFVAMVLQDIGSQWRIDWDEVGASFVPEAYGGDN
jgi:hypothetical protein